MWDNSKGFDGKGRRKKRELQGFTEKSSKKSKNIAFPRQICMYLCRNLTEFSLEDIGKSLGNRDHTTILYGIQKIEKDVKTDRSLQNTIEVLIKKISPQ